MPTQVFTIDDAQELIRSTALAVVSEYQRKRTPPILSKKQLAEYLDKPISTINRWMKEGLPFRKEGNDYPEFYLPHVNRWMEERFDERVQTVSGKANNSEGQELEQGPVVRL